MKNPKSNLPRQSEAKAGIHMTTSRNAGRRPNSAGTPRTSRFKRALLAALLLSTLNLPLSTSAQGTAFTYQGRFTDNGSPYTGVVEFQPTLWDAASGGSQVAANSPAQIAVGVTNGLFVLPLDFASNFPGADRWLQLEVRTTPGPFTPLTPRQQLTPTPYAMTASNLTGPLPAVQLSGTVANERLSPSVSLLGQSIDSAEITDGIIVNADVSDSAAIADTKLATIVTPGKVADSALSVGVSLLGQSIESAEIANGTIVPADVNTASFSNTFWRIGGYAGTNPTNGVFLGTTDNQPLEIKVNGLRALRIEAPTNGFGDIGPNIVGGHSVNIVSNGFIGAVIGGGGHPNFPNRVGNNWATVVGGIDNTASGQTSTAMGRSTTASGFHSTAMGFETTASGNASTAMGNSTTARGVASTAMGDHTTASGDSSTAMGDYTTASGLFSTALGNQTTASGGNSFAMGYATIASGYTSIAMGNFARANHDGSFVWADSHFGDFPSTADDQFSIRAAGGVRLSDGTPNLSFGSTTRQMVNLFSTTYGMGVQESTLYMRSNSRFSWFRGGSHSNSENIPGAGGTVAMTLDASGLRVNGAFVSSSDRNVKERFEPVNSRDVLEHVAALPLARWSYKEDPGTRHLGPMAQDFYAAFNVGPDDKHIATVDADGVALAAIQGLNQKLTEELKRRDAENAELKQSLAELKALVQSLASQQNGGAK